MQISKYINPKLIRLEMESYFEPPEDGDELTGRQKQEQRTTILSEFVDVLELSGSINNRTKLLTDFINREKKATTALGRGIAIPHVRSMQAKELIIGFCRTSAGLDFDSLDGDPVHIFVPMAAPPYDDNLYLKVFKELAEMFAYGSFYEKVMEAEKPYDIILAVKELE